MLPIEFINVLPEVIINIICEYADTGTRIIYDTKREIYVYLASQLSFWGILGVLGN